MPFFYKFYNKQRDSKVGSPNQQITYDIEPSMEFAPLAAMPSWWPTGVIEKTAKKIT